ncbi:MAG TPA: UDP-4-amino-4,6-dideoxy-N-acetyl-beta-L-altrosamine transaminase [Lentisphaeria bacterium]|nr:MAG: UDP-4-amino-4,6-dideoxy-N-acetyl-beta-L-altrosamine transaminase [Lentisphaerae bacterium GWF2_50_93]HCE45655.1 UDP-4-amino-4,6-dideoxy-N-acetyl-beta-L-altrosamine transaminase [Lentisphaeria bacterium]
MNKTIPYGKQSIDRSDIDAVTEVLQSDFITTGPKVSEFEKSICDFTGAKFAVAVSSGTAALHCAMFAAGIKPGDEVIVTPMTFVASSNAILYCGGTPVFADVLPGSLLIDPAEVEKKITERTKAVVAVDYAGQPCDYGALRGICKKHGLLLISDACHSIGAKYKGGKTGTLADMTAFSFHPVKHITTGEGGMITIDNPDFAARLKMFRGHGISTDYRQREEKGSWFYEMVDLGYNYRITDFQCALGISQLKKLPGWISRRQEIAAKYDAEFKDNPSIIPIRKSPDISHAYHLYVIKLEKADRNQAFTELRNSGIGVNVHYIPVHLHPYYKKTFGTTEGLCPVAEDAFRKIISLPMFPGLKDEELKTVITKIKRLS